jgi:CRISPR type III-B/RAMP module-associated protein Cmr3
MSHLLAFHLGPVQDFIATARRTQDWWMGSWLLSHLTRKAIEIAQQKGASLVLPMELVGSLDPAIADTPNHFFARIGDAHPAEVAREVELGVRCEWWLIHRKVKSELFDHVANDLWTRQLEVFLEIYWAVMRDDSTKEARNRAYDALDARKRLRDFACAEEPHLKCSLCGLRQELSGKTSVGEARAWWQRLVDGNRGRLRVPEDGSERLCGVCAVKRSALRAGALRPRLDKDDGHFPSTSNVAVAPFKRRLLETARGQIELTIHFNVLERHLCIPAQIDEFCLPGLAAVTSPLSPNVRKKLLTFDGDLFFTELFTEERIREEFPGALSAILKAGATEIDVTEEELLELEPGFVAQQIGRAATSLRALFRAVRSDEPEKHIALPSKYFSVLKLDGDRMGAFFSGTSEGLAQDLSQRLSKFSHDEAPAIVARHSGRLVYAGGDDAMALLPLVEVLPCARTLQEEFRRAVNGVGVTPPGLTLPTPSIGIVIAHHTAPLDGVLLAVQLTEKAAKKQYGRDAVCVHVLKRSGEEVRVGSHWRYGDLDTVGLMTRLIEGFHREILWMQFAQAMATEARALDSERVPAVARAAALRRLARRHCPEDQQPMAEILVSDLAAWAEGRGTDDARTLGMDEVARWVLLARFIASGGGRGLSPQHIFIEPSDVWLFRNARPFAVGEQGRAVSLFPPTPRTIQGVVRSARLAQSGEPFNFRLWSTALQAEIGQPDDFGALHLRGPLVARRQGQDVHPFFPLPLDITSLQKTWRILSPQPARRFETNWHPALLPLLPTHEAEPDKFEPGWLPEAALMAYLCVDESGLEVRESKELFVLEPRFGVQIDSGPKRPREGMLFQVEFVRVEANVGLLVEVSGVPLAAAGLLQLGGEARAGSYTTVQRGLDLPRSGRLKNGSGLLHFKLYLATPAIFKSGWLPGWLDSTTLAGQYNSVAVQLVATAVGKPQPVGGRDIARRDRQRAIQRAVPAGSVYFFETRAAASDVMDAFDGQCLSDVDAQIGFGLSYVGGW